MMMMMMILVLSKLVATQCYQCYLDSFLAEFTIRMKCKFHIHNKIRTHIFKPINKH